MNQQLDYLRSRDNRISIHVCTRFFCRDRVTAWLVKTKPNHAVELEWTGVSTHGRSFLDEIEIKTWSIWTRATRITWSCQHVPRVKNFHYCQFRNLLSELECRQYLAGWRQYISMPVSVSCFSMISTCRTMVQENEYISSNVQLLKSIIFKSNTSQVHFSHYYYRIAMSNVRRSACYHH
jgi:hypothetical protein